MKKIETTSFDFFFFFSLLLLKLQGTNRYFQRIAAEVGLDVSFADCTKPEKLKSALKPNTKVSQARLSKNWHLPIDFGSFLSTSAVDSAPAERWWVKRGQMLPRDYAIKAAGKRLQMFACSFAVNEWIVTVVV